MKISVIIPVYNGEKYIKKTIEMVLNQKYKEIELILVNDGSTDNSKQICEYYEKADSRVKVINKTNGGICSARNMGIKYASGEYISFIDQDDEIVEDIYQILIEGYKKNIDLVISGKVMEVIDENNNVVTKKEYVYSRNELKDMDMIYAAFNTNRNMCLLQIWNCLYKREIIVNNNICFDSQFRFGHEDTLFNLEYIRRCKKIMTIPGIVYKYYRRVNVSTSMKKNENYIHDYLYFIRKTHDLFNINELGIKDIFYTYSFRLGISLYRQYSLENTSDLILIYNGINDICDNGNIISKGKLGMVYTLYLKCIVLFIRCKKYKIANKMICIKRRT